MMENDFILEWELKKIVCKNIKKFRNESCMTQLELSERIGISHEYIRQLESENGQKDFSFYTLYKLSVVLNVPLGDFIGID